MEARVFFAGVTPTSGIDVMTVSMGEDRKVEAVLQSPFNEGDATVSPDGRWLAYQSNDSGQYEILGAGLSPTRPANENPEDPTVRRTASSKPGLVGPTSHVECPAGVAGCTFVFDMYVHAFGLCLLEQARRL